MRVSRMHGSGIYSHPDELLSVASVEISRCGWTAKANAGSGARNYRPEASQNIRGRVHLPVQNMPGVMTIFICIKKQPKGRENRRSRCRIKRTSQIKNGRSSAKEPWLIFICNNDFKPIDIMKLYSLRMQIGQNFRDEKASA